MTHNVIRFAQIAERYPESSVPEDDEDGSNENDEDGSNENETNTKMLQKPKGRYVTYTTYIYNIPILTSN
jgi:hypothetical protein